NDIKGLQQWYLVKKDSLYGLYSFTYPYEQIDRKIVEENSKKRIKEKHQLPDTIYMGEPIGYNEQLPPTLDSITRYKDDKKYPLLKIYKDSLTGIYPIHSKP